MKNKTDLSIIILNYNGQFWLKKTLTTLKKFYIDRSQYVVEVIVVDNNSTDDSARMVRKQFKWVKLLTLPENVGFAAGNNAALKLVKSRYVMLLNSDVELTPNSNLDLILDYHERFPEIGIITPRLEFPNGQLDLASHRGEPTLWASFTYFTKLEKIWPKTEVFGRYHQLYKDLSSPHFIDACSGAAMIIKTKAMKEVGLLDERFFMYAEDLDWCKRFREAGWGIAYFPGVILIHHKNKSGISSSSKATARRTSELFYDTMLVYYDKHYADHYPKWIRSSIKLLIELKKEAL